jgi:hypothetical protein
MSIFSNPFDARESNSVCICNTSSVNGPQDAINRAFRSLNRAMLRTLDGDTRGRRFLGSVGAGAMDAPCACQMPTGRGERK